MKLRKWMDEKGVSCRAMAKLVGVHHTSIFYYCNGKRRPTVKIAEVIEKVTDGKVRAKDLR